jgi:hypothetical protein
MALPTALFAAIASFGLASAAVMSSIDSQRGTTRDQYSKNAIAAADAGASVALMRLNRYQNSLNATTQCVNPAGVPQTPSGGWCPATSAESVGGATFTYQVSAFTPGSGLTLVATGTAGSVSRRITVGAISVSGGNIFANEHAIGQDGISLDGTPDIRTDIGTNGDVTTDGDGTICGNVRHGVGKTAPDPQCQGTVTEGNKNLPPVMPPADIATNNSNCRLDLSCPEIGVDTYTKHRSSTNPWDATNRIINVGANATLTLGGSDYFVCGLFLDNGQLIMAAGAKVRIFFDTPEHCGLSAGDPQVSITGNANIVSTAYNPSQGTYDVPGLYLLGSPKIPTTVNLGGGSGTNELILYAPYSDVQISGNATWIGMVAGKTLSLSGTPIIASDPGMAPPDIAAASLLQRTRYVECTGATASPPNANC